MINKKLDKYDKIFLSLLSKLYKALSKNCLNFNEIKSIIDEIAKFDETVEYCYLNDLMYPEKCKGVKIPSLMPVPSCSFQLHNSVMLSTNNSGNLAIIFNPFLLVNKDNLVFNPRIDFNNGKNFIENIEYVTSLYVNNSTSLDGRSNNDNFRLVDIGQSLPGVYTQYRLVSASITLKYIGRMDVTSGVIGGAIIFDDPKYIGCRYTLGIVSPFNTIRVKRSSPNPYLAKYGNFDLAMDSFYHQENTLLEGIRELYFPIDNSYEEYIKTFDISTPMIMEHSSDGTTTFRVEDVDNYKTGFNFFIYTLGAPRYEDSFKLDIYCNFECLPNSSYLNYLPVSVNSGYISNNDKRSIINIIQEKPIFDLKSENNFSNKPSIWTKLEKKFSGTVPGIKKMGFLY